MSDITDKTELIIEIIHYAEEHDLDINDKNDVKKILMAIGSEHSEEEIKELMDDLDNATTFMDLSARKLVKDKTKQPN